ncbi:MltA-interacting MipA family protein [Vibrio sagamiensis NBRC 104589]|uniref:MltA-interacting MipA family protein n=2 Tax=Vibrio sagamiensis TaxID=512650 RepID=A0A511QBC4_9VIBR|nr:MipA/OmpV family protein [Vibrio sagamiensis]GEM74517.1 MltA-interacting MipA family protein [Vibrio sagamiensis NBRC 104589]
MWGIAALKRMATIPFDTVHGDSTVSTYVPMMFFENEYVYLNGIEGGVFLYGNKQSDWLISTIMRLRFVDIPKSVQNAYGGDRIDAGFQWQYKLSEHWFTDVEIMSDDEGQSHSNFRVSTQFELGNLEMVSDLTLRYKTTDFNSEYYSFKDATGESIGAGIDMRLGVKGRYHVTSNLYLLGGASVTRLDNQAFQSAVVKDRYEGEVFLGFGFFNDKTKPYKEQLNNSQYLRVAHGWATPSNIGEIFKFNSKKDNYNHQLSSLFYGYPLTDSLFDFPVALFVTPGIAHHWSSSQQSSSTEFVMAIKAYYTFEWPTQWRFGVGEGVSYIDSITYIEATELKEKSYTPSHLLNYLDFSIDVNIGDLFQQKQWNDIWVGYSLHHRSAIFEKASQFGRIKGGSNYNTMYIQFDF